MNQENVSIGDRAKGQSWPAAVAEGRGRLLLSLVNPHDLRELREALARGVLPPDFEDKLERLAAGDLLHWSIDQNCRLLIALFLAAQDGGFCVPASVQDQLLRVLAYVRKDDDAIPDYRPGGFADDQQALRAAVADIAPLLQQFKAWRLRHQVPALWQAQPSRSFASAA